MIQNRNVRFNIEKEQDRKAWEILHSNEIACFKSQNEFIITAIISYYERHMISQNDPYFETREREIDFVEKIVNTVENKVLSNLPALMGMYLMSLQGVGIVSTGLTNEQQQKLFPVNVGVQAEPEENNLLDIDNCW